MTPWRRGLRWGMAAFAVTPAAVVALMVLVERRPFRLEDQYLAFVVGDPLLALAVGVAAAAPGSSEPRAPAWVLPTVAVAALAVGWWQLDNEITRGVYTVDQAHSPSKLWHQLVVYPVLASLLTVAGWRARHHVVHMLVAGILVSGWCAALVYDQFHPKSPHVDFNWPFG